MIFFFIVLIKLAVTIKMDQRQLKNDIELFTSVFFLLP